MPSISERLSAKDHLAVALDFPNVTEAIALVDRLGNICSWYKVGMELYYAAGDYIVRQLHDRGFSVFLDLKLHDIPNTVAAAVRSVSQTGASLLTIHATGGAAMMSAAAVAAASPGAPRLLAVTVLTSMDAKELANIGIEASPADEVLRLAKLAQTSGINSFVCSPEEVAMLRKNAGPDSLLVVPGIRPTGSETGDQKRIATPTKAIADGASLLVVGRPITRAADPVLAAHSILEEIQEAIEQPIAG
ncbi:MAG TPA: orotidine-5'-phosphate decarboxylase [Edaphobacter sp.]|jgi:orotidine-5'-phosphate decarboxylase|nr:orotidine-5'-phosphate decarboxylase [Edaphobacter sp.]